MSRFLKGAGWLALLPLLALPFSAQAAKIKVDPRKDTYTKAYVSYLGRQPSAAELTASLKKFLNLDRLKKSLLASTERKQVISDMYLDQFCRSVQVTELADFTKKAQTVAAIQAILAASGENCVAKKPVVSLAPLVPLNNEVPSVSLMAQVHDPFARTLTYQWRLVSAPGGVGTALSDDGSTSAVLTLGSDAHFTDYYAAPGDYIVRLTVTNSANLSSAATTIVRVSPFTTLEQSMLVKVNDLRVGLGLNPLQLEAKLTAAARKYSNYMRVTNWFDHNDQNGGTFDRRISAENYNFAYVGENILSVKSSGAKDFNLDEKAVQFFFDGWKNSPLHYENLVGKDFKELGVGFSAGASPDTERPFAQYGAQEFGALVPPGFKKVEVKGEWQLMKMK